MELIKSLWTKKDIKPFQEYLKTFSKGKEKGTWEKRIVNTQLPCIAVPCKVVKQIVNKIAKGNFLSFIDLWIWENYTNTAIIGNLICKIKDFNLQKNYLLQYAMRADCWATIDTIKPKITLKNENDYINFATDLLVDNHTFVRRLGIIILLKCTTDRSVETIYCQIEKLFNEKEYYVNMAVAWLLAECFVKERNKTLNFLKTGKLSTFVLNKTISKCCDSLRVSKEDKILLKSLRKK